MLLRLVDGESNSAVARRYRVSRPTVSLWRRRFAERGMDGLHNELKSGRPRSTSEEQIAQLVNTTLKRKINAFVEQKNQHPRPFTWTATAESILAKIERLCKVINGTSH